MNYELKHMIEKMYELGDTLDEGTLGLYHNTNKTLRDCVRFELCSYLMYLSAADGKIAWQEAEFIRDYLGYDLQTDEINQFIVENQIYSTDFEEKVPVSMQIFVRADNTIYDQDGYIETMSSELLLWIYERLGKEFLACDNDISDNEIRDLTIYLNMLKTYIENEAEGKKSYNKKAEKILNNEENFLKKNGSTEENESLEESLEDLLNELNSMTGLADVKKDVNSLINLLQIRKIREERGMKQTPMSLHLVFSGNPVNILVR